MTSRMRWFTMVWLLAGCSAAPAPIDEPDGAPPPPEPAVVSAGEALYDKYCKLCHGDDGAGYAADNANALANPDFLASVSDEFLRLAIWRGRPGTSMAAYNKSYGGPLSGEEVEQIIGYLRSFERSARVPVDEHEVGGDHVAGKAIFAQHCQGCHGETGHGKTAPSINNPLFLGSASDGFIRYAIAQGRRGTPMPGFEGKLTPQQIDDVTRYVRTLTRNVDTTPSAGEIPPSFEQVVINPDGPPPQFSPLREGRYVPAAEVAAALKQGARLVLLDARPSSDWLKSHIPGALPLPYYEPERMIDALPSDGTWIISYCGCPHAASGKVMDTLRAAGFPNTAVIDEGIFVWMERGYPLTFGAVP